MAAQLHSLGTLRGIYATTPGERIDCIQRGLPAASDCLAALRSQPGKLAADALANQLAGLLREAQKLAHQLGEQDAGGSPNAG